MRPWAVAVSRVVAQIAGLWLILQTAEWIVAQFQIPVPGNVVGMALLFVLLATGLVRESWLHAGASLLSRLLAFFLRATSWSRSCRSPSSPWGPPPMARAQRRCSRRARDAGRAGRGGTRAGGGLHVRHHAVPRSVAGACRRVILTTRRLVADSLGELTDG